jgi:hypothetical protein
MADEHRHEWEQRQHKQNARRCRLEPHSPPIG